MKTFEEYEARYKPLINSIIKNKYVSGYDYEDLYQEALMVLNKCMQEFDGTKLDVSKYAQFSTFLYTSIKNHIYNLIKKANREKRPKTIYLDLIELDEKDTLDDYDIDHSELEKEIIEKLSTMPRGDITLMYYISQMSNKEIADYLGISQSRVQFLNKRNIKKLKEIFADRL